MKAATMPPGKSTVAMRAIDAYVAEYMSEFFDPMEDEPAPAIFLAIMAADSPAEKHHLARALLIREEGLCDAAYRIGGERCNPLKLAMAIAIGRWEA